MMVIKHSQIFLLLSVLLASGAQAALINVIDGDHDVINGSFSGHLGLNGLGHTSTLLSDTSSGWSTATSENAIIVVEQGGLDSANSTDVLNFMSGGGRFIVLGDTFNNTESFLGALYGTSLVTGYEPYLGIATKTVSAAGTSFADDAGSLVALSSTHPITSGLPIGSEVFFSGTGGDWVTRTTFGSGDLFYFGWDYCCAGSIAQGNDWYGALDSAINFSTIPPSVSVPEPGTFALMGLGLLGLMTRLRKKVK